MDVDLLFTIPSDKDEIRHRLNSCLDYFAKIRASELGLNPVTLRQALPDVAFFDELPYENIHGSALGAFNYSDYIVKINEEAIFSGKIFLEMIVFHEFTHALDALIVDSFIDTSEYLRWLKRYISRWDMLRFNNCVPTDYDNPEFVPRPRWEGDTQHKACQLMEQIIDKPEDFFELGDWQVAKAPKSALVKQIIRNNLGTIANVEDICKYFMAMQYRYLCCFYRTHKIPISIPISDIQRTAIDSLKSQGYPKIINFAHKLKSIPASLKIGSAALTCGLKAYNVSGYFDLPEELQIDYLCASGETRARREASRVLLKAIEDHCSKSRTSENLQAEIKTLKSSIRLENLLQKWKLLSDSTLPDEFAVSQTRKSIEAEIHIHAANARTHKLIKRFYPNEAVYQLCREWNDKRLLPIPANVRNTLTGLSKHSSLTSIFPIEAVGMPAACEEAGMTADGSH